MCALGTLQGDLNGAVLSGGRCPLPALRAQGAGSFVEVYRGSECNLCFYTTRAFSHAGCKVEPLIPKTLHPVKCQDSFCKKKLSHIPPPYFIRNVSVLVRRK